MKMTKRWVLVICCIVYSANTIAQSLEEILMPRYMYGNGATGRDVLPYICRVKLTGLLPNTTYRYMTCAVTTSESKTATGTGITVVMNNSGAFNRYAATSFSTTAPVFITNADGEYTGWFGVHPVGNARFTPGNELQVQINLNLPSNGTTVAHRLYSTSTITAIRWGNTTSDATAIRSSPALAATGKDFVMLYDKETPGAGDRPISGAFIENDEFDVSVYGTAQTGYASFYKTAVDKVGKAWGAYIPNNLAAGIRNMTRYNFEGTKMGENTSADGIWAMEGGGTVSTVNATGGLTNVIALDGNEVKLGIAGTTPQTISFAAFPAKKYGDAAFAAGATTSSGLSVTYGSSNPSVAVVVNGEVHIRGAGTAEITASQAGDATYLPAPDVKQMLTVSKIPLAIVADAKQKIYNRPTPSLTVQYTGFLAGETSAVLTAQPSVSTTAVKESLPGEYPITVSGATAANYEISYQHALLTILPLPDQTISFESIPAHRYGDADFMLNGTASSGLMIFYASSNPDVAVVRGSTIHITGVGTTNITATQPGNIFFAPATPVTRSLVVNKGSITIRVDDEERTTNEPNPAFSLHVNGMAEGEDLSNLTVRPEASTTAHSDSRPGTYPIIVGGGSSNNYEISYINGTLTIIPSLLEKKDELGLYCDAPGQLKISLFMLAAEPVNIILFNTGGKLKNVLSATTVKGINEFHMDVSKLPSGIYPVIVNNSRITLKGKAVILK